MTGTIVYETLRRNWRKTLYWGLGFLLYAIYPYFIVQDQEALSAYADVAARMESIMSAFGVEDAGYLATPEGFIGYAYFSFMLLIFAVFAVLAGLDITANDEDTGIMDMFMGLPVPRWRLVVEKLTAYSMMIVAISLAGFAGLMIGKPIASSSVAAEIANTRLLEGAVNLIPGTLLMLSFTALVSVIVRRKSMAAGITGAFVIVSYLADTIGRAAGGDIAETVRQFSFFAYYEGTTILSTGLVASSVLGLLAVAALFAGGTVWFFQRRDIAA